MGAQEPTKKEAPIAGSGGENPGVTIDDLLAKLLVTLLTSVINKLLTELSTTGGIRKLLGLKAPE